MGKRKEMRFNYDAEEVIDYEFQQEAFLWWITHDIDRAKIFLQYSVTGDEAVLNSLQKQFMDWMMLAMKKAVREIINGENQ